MWVYVIEQGGCLCLMLFNLIEIKTLKKAMINFIMNHLREHPTNNSIHKSHKNFFSKSSLKQFLKVPHVTKKIPKNFWSSSKTQGTVADLLFLVENH